MGCDDGEVGDSHESNPPWVLGYLSSWEVLKEIGNGADRLTWVIAPPLFFSLFYLSQCVSARESTRAFPCFHDFWGGDAYDDGKDYNDNHEFYDGEPLCFF